METLDFFALLIILIIVLIGLFNWNRRAGNQQQETPKPKRFNNRYGNDQPLFITGANESFGTPVSTNHYNEYQQGNTTGKHFSHSDRMLQDSSTDSTGNNFDSGTFDTDSGSDSSCDGD